MKPNKEARAIGLTAKDGDALRDSLGKLTEIHRGLETLSSIADGFEPLCTECGAMRDGVRDLLHRFYSVAPEPGE